MKKLTVSVVLPVYNEELTISKTCAAVLQYSIENPEYEFVFVDDGSLDNTLAILTDQIAASGSSRITVVGYAENRGKGFAIQHGYSFTKGDCIAMADGDLAYSLDQLDRLVEELQDNDVAIGVRTARPWLERGGLPLYRKILGQGFNRIVRLLFSLPYTDTQAGLKGFRRPAATAIFSRCRLTRFASDVEIIVIAKRQNLKIGQVDVVVSPSHQESGSAVRPIRDSIQMFSDLLCIKWNCLRDHYA